MKVAVILSLIVLPSSIGFSQEPQRPTPARPAPAERGAEAQRPNKPAPDFLPSREWAQLVENLVENCQGKLRCVVGILEGILNDPKATPATKEAANHLMARAKNALAAQDGAKDDAERERMDAGMRENLVKRRLAAAQAEAEQARAAAQREVEAGRMTQEGLRERMARIEAERKALHERLHRGVAPRNDRAPAPPRPAGGGGRG